MFGKRLILAGAAAAVVAALPVAFGLVDELEHKRKQQEGAKDRKQKILAAYKKGLSA